MLRDTRTGRESFAGGKNGASEGNSEGVAKVGGEHGKEMLERKMGRETLSAPN